MENDPHRRKIIEVYDDGEYPRGAIIERGGASYRVLACWETDDDDIERAFTSGGASRLRQLSVRRFRLRLEETDQ